MWRFKSIFIVRALLIEWTAELMHHYSVCSSARASRGRRTNGALLCAAPPSVSSFISRLCVTSAFQRPILASLPSDEPAALPDDRLPEAGEEDGAAGSVPESRTGQNVPISSVTVCLRCCTVSPLIYNRYHFYSWSPAQSNNILLLWCHVAVYHTCNTSACHLTCAVRRWMCSSSVRCFMLQLDCMSEWNIRFIFSLWLSPVCRQVLLMKMRIWWKSSFFTL